MNVPSVPKFSGIYSPHVYNRRLQPVLEYAVVGGSGQVLFKRCYDFHLNGGINISYGVVTCSFPGASTGDNGNVFQIANKIDYNRTQNFTYDPLNRITSAYTNGPNWGETYTIDAWGNLANRGPVTGKTVYEPLNCAASTRNRGSRMARLDTSTTRRTGLLAREACLIFTTAMAPGSRNAPQVLALGPVQQILPEPCIGTTQLAK